jgi:hypothetical protein
MESNPLSSSSIMYFYNISAPAGQGNIWVMAWIFTASINIKRHHYFVLKPELYQRHLVSTFQTTCRHFLLAPNTVYCFFYISWVDCPFQRLAKSE